MAFCRGDTASALNVILTDCPYGDGVDEAKVSFDDDPPVERTGLYVEPLEPYHRRGYAHSQLNPLDRDPKSTQELARATTG